jgi:O-antigen ligase
LRKLLRPARLDASVSVVLALTILAFAAGSSSVSRAGEIGRPARWALLGVLAVLAVLYAAERGLPRIVPYATVAATSFLILAVASTLWSAAPRLTFDRSAALALVLLAAVLIAHGSGGESERAERILYGVLGGAVAVGLVSLVVGIADPGAAGSLHSRFKGFGQQATTDAMLYALALPLALLAALRARKRATLAAAAAAFVLVDGLLIVSGSRGPTVGAVLGLVLVGLACRGRAQLAVGGLALGTIALALAVGFVQTREQAPAAPARAAPSAPARYPNPGLLSQELGSRSNSSAIRSLFRTSGRTGAWRGAVEKADRRPALGYGLGTEDRVFENRYYGYQGDLVGSSWVGLYLQLGAFGVATLAAVWVVLVAAAWRARRNPVALACAAVALAAFPITFVESWIYAAGNLACLPFWLAALLLGTLAHTRPQAPPEAFRARRREADPVVA